MHNIGEFMDSITKNFGSKLKSYRRGLCITQEKFAEMIDINLRQLARIEAGESFVSSKTLLKICQVLNVPPNILFDFDLKNINSEISKENDMQFNVIDVSNNSESKEFNELKNNLLKISNDKIKIEYINLAYNSLFDKKALEDLKIMIKGIELTK